MKKVGIFTFYDTSNYGAMLQAYATLKSIEKLGYQASFVNYHNEYENKNNQLFSYRKNLSFKENSKILIKNCFFGVGTYTKKIKSRFLKSIPLSKFQYNKSNINELENENYDILVSGSDQIWNPSIFGGKMDYTFMLDFLTTARKISYASSIGSTKIIEKEKTKKVLESFSAISVREDFAQNEIKDLGILNVKKVCDPTMLFEKSDWQFFSKQSSITIPNNPYLLVYLMSPYEEYQDILHEIATVNSLNIVFVTFSDLKRKYVDIYYKGATPSDFVYLIENAAMIASNSFHGIVFSLLFNKKFFALKNAHNPKRVENLLKQFSLEKRIVEKIEDIKLASDIDFDFVNKTLSSIRTDSIEWLEKSLKEDGLE